VVRALNFARSQSLLVAVRGGGHNVAGKAICDDGLVIDLSPMKGIQVDPTVGLARAEGGLTWGEFDRETQAFGLATTGGFISTTGIGGLTLGGGLGWLMRKYGLACDNLQSVKIVTADGQIRTANAEENPDLFWGVRGGGGNFGVVTSFEYQLHPAGQMLAGVVFFPLQQAVTGLRFYRDFMARAPDELMAYAVFLTAPDGNKMFAIPVCYVGPVHTGEQVLRPLRDFAGPAANGLAPMGYCQIQSMFDAGFPPGRQHYWKSSVLRHLSDKAIDTIVEYFGAVPSPMSAVAIEPFGGAVARVGVDETAFPHRDAAFSIVMVGMWMDRSLADPNIRWIRNFWKAMQPFATDAVYVNYLDADEADRVPAAYSPATFKRLREIKRKYDPDNFFRVNQNIGTA
jgi:FAD/FMN-containing dehydrogenase